LVLIIPAVIVIVSPHGRLWFVGVCGFGVKPGGKSFSCQNDKSSTGATQFEIKRAKNPQDRSFLSFDVLSRIGP
jgi:hypothetical protein